MNARIIWSTADTTWQSWQVCARYCTEADIVMIESRIMDIVVHSPPTCCVWVVSDIAAQPWSNDSVLQTPHADSSSVMRNNRCTCASWECPFHCHGVLHRCRTTADIRIVWQTAKPIISCSHAWQAATQAITDQCNSQFDFRDWYPGAALCRDKENSDLIMASGLHADKAPAGVY